MSGFVKVHTVNNVTLRYTAGLRRETERERGFCWIDNHQDQTGDSMLKTRGKSGASSIAAWLHWCTVHAQHSHFSARPF